MDHIASALGISKKTLYTWVPSKTAIVNLLIDQFIEEDKDKCSFATTHSENALHELMLAFEKNLNQLELMKSNVIFDIQHYHLDAWEKMKSYQRNFITDVITANLHRGIQEGLYRSDLDIEIVARLHGHQIFNLFDEDWFPTQRYARVQVLREFIKGYAYSISNEKGRQYLVKHWK